MDKTKKTIFLSAIFFSFFLAICFPALAQENQASAGQGSDKFILIATVRVYKATIKEQDGNKAKISFDLYNDLGVQPNVFYAVSLMEDNEGQALVDRKVFDERISLGEKETVSREVEYVIPQNLKGNFKLYVEVRNSDGITLGYSLAGSLSPLGSVEFLQIDKNSCKIKNIASNVEKGFSEGILGSSEDKYIASCVVKNNSGKNSDAYFSASARKKSPLGELFYENGKNISFAAREEKKIEIEIEQLNNRQASFLKLSFNDEKGNAVSNSVSTVIFNEENKLSFLNVRFNKDIYEKDEMAEISFNVESMEKDPVGYNIEFTIVDKAGNSCIDPNVFTRNISKDEIKDTIRISKAISFQCISPVLSASIKDKDGNIIDSENYFVDTKSVSIDEYLKKQEKKKKMSDFVRNIVVFICGLILLIILLGKIGNKIKYRNFKFPIYLLVFILPFFTFSKSASAETYLFPLGAHDVAAVVQTRNLNPFGSRSDDNLFHVDEKITIEASVTNNGYIYGQPFPAGLSGTNGFGYPCEQIMQAVINLGETKFASKTFSGLTLRPGTYGWFYPAIGVDTSSCSQWLSGGYQSYEDGVCSSKWNGKTYTGPAVNSVTGCHESFGDEWCKYGCIHDNGGPLLNSQTGKLEWTCYAIRMGTIGDCSANISINNKCGSDANLKICDISLLSRPCIYENGWGENYTTNLTGANPGKTPFSGPFSWTCKGFGGGTSANCSTAPVSKSICGSAISNSPSATAPSVNLCQVGTPSAVKIGWQVTTWEWTCSAGLATYDCDVTCNAPKIQPGQCSGQTSYNSKNDILYNGCSNGTVTDVNYSWGSDIEDISGTGNPWTWTCTSAGGGSGVCSGYAYPTIDFKVNGNNSNAIFPKNTTVPFAWSVKNASASPNGCVASCNNPNSGASCNVAWYSPLWSGNQLHADGANNQVNVLFKAIGKASFKLRCINEKSGASEANVTVDVQDSVVLANCGSANNKDYCSAPADSTLCGIGSNPVLPVKNTPDPSKYSWTCLSGGNTVSCSAKKKCSTDAIWKEIDI